MLELRLPYPPSVNTYWRHNRGRTHISKVGARYRADVRAIVLQENVLVGRQPLTGRLCLTLGVFPPDRRKRDLDNVPKAIQDALQHAGVIEDDEQFDVLIVRRRDVIPDGGVIATIRKIEP